MYSLIILLTVGLLVLASSILLVSTTSLLSWRGRRRLYGRWQRLVRWEYWPGWLFYGPVFCAVICHGIRHGNLTLFTAANPGMGSDSGFAGESKLEILEKLAAAGDAVATWTGIDKQLSVEGKLEHLRAFMVRQDLTYPIVLKPDVGERGSGVAIVRSDGAAADYMARCPGHIIAQRYVAGCEYGIFFVRMPGESGRIFGITDKRFSAVTGDGQHTLEELILADDRAVCMWKFYQAKYGKYLNHVISSGTKYTLAELGTHCRGSLFLDGSALVTAELEDWARRISGVYDGFYFGRYDVRVPSEEDLQAGRNISIIELNGISSEATWVYDPRYSVFYAWQTFFRQWRMAFAIAAANRTQGHQAQPIRDTIQSIAERLNRETFEA